MPAKSYADRLQFHHRGTQIRLDHPADTQGLFQRLDGDRDPVAEKLGSAPEFFRHAPVIIDLGDMPDDMKAHLDFSGFLRILQIHTLAPVGHSRRLHRASESRSG
jgi:septum formation inhibitor MinC